LNPAVEVQAGRFLNESPVSTPMVCIFSTAITSTNSGVNINNKAGQCFQNSIQGKGIIVVMGTWSNNETILDNTTSVVGVWMLMLETVSIAKQSMHCCQSISQP
jgi:hypothetical protein